MLYALIVINVIVYYLMLYGKVDYHKIGMSYDTVFRQKQFYRIFTAAFTHASVMHLALNMLALYNVGRLVIAYFGAIGFLIIYFGSMIAGHLLSLYIHHDNSEDTILSMGASGPICGLIAAYLVLVVFRYGFVAAMTNMATTLLSLLIISFMPRVDGTTHICCFAFGMAIAYIMMII